MVVVDTNLISELMRDQPNPNVVTWSATVGQPYTTAVTVAEIEYGVARLPDGRRQDRLAAATARLFADFDDRVLSFDARAARHYAEIVVERERAGRPIATADAQIAAICASRQAILATRNTGDFEGTGIGLVNPWNFSSR